MREPRRCSGRGQYCLLSRPNDGLHRPGLAVDGGSYPWDPDGIYTAGEFLYSNCDTQILGEILFRATGQDAGTFAQTELFEPINMNATWWRDDVESGQANGNYLTYCCLDATPRDFAKFGYLLLLGGIELESGTQYSNYVSGNPCHAGFLRQTVLEFLC